MVHTKPTMSMKFAAIVLAILCGIMFTPAIAWTSNANAAAKLKVSPTKATIYVAKTKTITAKGLSKAKLKKVKWTTSSKSVATISKTKGSKTVVKGKKTGKATITAKYGKMKAKTTITVKKAVGTPTISGTAKVGETLTATVGGTVSYQWYADGTAISGATSKTYKVGDVVGKAITVTVTGTGYYAGSKTSAATDKVIASAISNVVITLPSSTQTKPYVGDVLTATVLPTTAEATYQWYADGITINGATSSTYTVTAAELGKAITVKVAGANGFTGTATSAATASVIKNLSLGSIAVAKSVTTTTTLAAGETLTATVKDASATTLTSSDVDYAWYYDAYVAGSTTNKAAANSTNAATYTTTSADIGHTLICVASGKTSGTINYGGSLVSTATATVTDTIASAKLSTSTPAVGEKVTVSAKSTSGATDPTVTYQWYNGVDAISGATSASYVPTTDDQGKTLTCKVTGTGSYSGSAVISATTATAKGEITDVEIAGGDSDAAVGTELTAVMTPSTIATGDVTYQWYRSGVAINGATSATYTATKDDLTYDVTCKVTVTTAKQAYYTNASTPVTSNAVTIGKALASVTLSGTETTAGTLTATVTPAVADSTFTTTKPYTFKWYIDNTASVNQLGTGSPWAAATDDTLDLSKAATSTGTKVAGHKIVCVANGDVVKGYAGTVKATSGTITSVISASTTAIVAVVGTAADASASITPAYDTTSPQYTVQWYRDGTAISGATSVKYTPVLADYGKELKAVATGTGSYSGTVTLTDSSVGAATLTAGIGSATAPISTAQVGDKLSVVTGPADAAVSYQWYKADATGDTAIPTAVASSYTGYTAISGATASTYTVTDADYSVFCVVTPTNAAYGTTSIFCGILGGSIVE